MQHQPASAFSLAERTAQWNLGYTGYFSPVTFTEPVMDRWVTAGGFDLDNSLVWHDGDALVGFSYLAIREGRGWVGGFGVTPDYRGQGLSYQMFAEHLQHIRQLGLPHVQLEVLSQNWARKVYERAGFQVTRTLAVMNGPLPTDAAAPTDVKAGDPTALLTHFERLHAAHPAAWQRRPAYLLAAPPSAPLQALYTGPAAAPTGYVLYAVNGESGAIMHGAAQDETAAADLVAALAARHPGATMRLLNEPVGSPLHAALTAAGWQTAHTQYELHWAP